MAYTKRVSLIMGLAAVVSVGSALPADAKSMDMSGFDAGMSAMGDLAPAIDAHGPGALTPVKPADKDMALDVSDISLETEAPLIATDQTAEVAPEMAEAPTPDTSLLTAADVSTSANGLMASSSDLKATALSAFDASGLELALGTGQVEASGDFDTVQLAQSTRSAYRGVSPAYIGAGGNLGFGDRDESGVASMGFTVISKISLGPRFSLRPAALFTNQNTSFTVPLTYNLDLYELSGFRFQPYVGAGVDIPSGGDVGLLLDAGVDVPISRDFTLNAVTNWRVTSGFGFGFTLGVGYNFPWIFE